MKIRTQYLGLAAISGLCLLLTVAVSAVNLTHVGNDAERITAQAVLPQIQLARLDSALITSRTQALAGYLHDPSNPVSSHHNHPTQVHVQGVDKAIDAMREALDSLAKLPLNDDQRAPIEQLSGKVTANIEKVAKPSSLQLHDGRWADVAILVTLSNMQYLELKAQVDAATAAAGKIAVDASAHAADQVRQAIVLMSAVGLAALLVLGAGAWSGIRSIARSTAVATQLTNRLAQLDLRGLDVEPSRDEIGDMCRGLNKAMNEVASAFAVVRSGMDAVMAGATEIASGNMNLSDRTSSQASSVQATAAATDQLASTVQNNAQASREAHAEVSEAAREARSGGEATRQVVSTMSAISERSRRIADIIQAIEGIAFQTNILALNAAVEAARAGEQGRGFAVVASEVRALAQRSSLAAREIKQLIDDSVSTVELGSKQVSDAGVQIERLVERVQSVSGIVDRISSSSEEQAIGVKQVNEAVNNLDSVTQQNAALVEQAAAAAERLKAEAVRVQQELGRFKSREIARA